MTILGVQHLYTNHHLGVQHLPYQNVKKYRSEIMKDINFVKDNSNMTDEYIDAEIICDNEDPANCARIAHEVWDEVISNDKNTNDVGDSIWSQVLNVLQNRIQNGLEEEIALEVREIIWENYVPEWESYL